MSEQPKKSKMELAKEAISGLSETELSEIQAEVETKKLKINLITIDETGLIEYVNTTTDPTTKFNNFTGKLLQNRRRFESAIRIRIKSLSQIPEGGTTTEEALLKIVPYLFSMLGTWGYRISNRDRNANPDNTHITNFYDLNLAPLDMGE